MPDAADEKQMKLRYAGACRLCGSRLTLIGEHLMNLVDQEFPNEE